MGAMQLSGSKSYGRSIWASEEALFYLLWNLALVERRPELPGQLQTLHLIEKKEIPQKSIHQGGLCEKFNMMPLPQEDKAPDAQVVSFLWFLPFTLPSVRPYPSSDPASSPAAPVMRKMAPLPSWDLVNTMPLA